MYETSTLTTEVGTTGFSPGTENKPVESLLTRDEGLGWVFVEVSNTPFQKLYDMYDGFYGTSWLLIHLFICRFFHSPMDPSWVKKEITSRSQFHHLWLWWSLSSVGKFVWSSHDPWQLFYLDDLPANQSGDFLSRTQPTNLGKVSSNPVGIESNQFSKHGECSSILTLPKNLTEPLKIRLTKGKESSNHHFSGANCFRSVDTFVRQGFLDLPQSCDHRFGHGYMVWFSLLDSDFAVMMFSYVFFLHMHII